MRHFSTVELTQKIGDVTHAASSAPVAITQHRKPRFVLMSVEEYERMSRRADPRRAWVVEEVPDALLAEMDIALAAYEAEQ